MHRKHVEENDIIMRMSPCHSTPAALLLGPLSAFSLPDDGLDPLPRLRFSNPIPHKAHEPISLRRLSSVRQIRNGS